ncbi:hypothetical protein CGRA01v4_08446 [Colletotrichum graminicola]|nr:hypothetical protein CGRA01v4_08446 [Colletotrichum graminicola]
MLVFLQPAFPRPAGSSAVRRLLVSRGAARPTVRRLNDQGRAMDPEITKWSTDTPASVFLAPSPRSPVSRLSSPALPPISAGKTLIVIYSPNRADHRVSPSSSQES